MTSDTQKVAAMQEWETPKEVTDLRSFLGLVSFADITPPAPLNPFRVDDL